MVEKSFAISFYISPNYSFNLVILGERISLAVTLMLAVTVFMLLVAETTPATSDAVPLVSVYFILCMVLMFLMIVLLCYINRMYHKKGSDGKMGAWMRR